MKNEKSYHILVAEDEPIIALELKQLLLRNNFDVLAVVNSGEDLIKESGKNEPDVIITDIHLKGKLTGIEAVKLINTARHIPFIFVTGHGDKITYNLAMAVSPDAYFLKPFDEIRLIDSVNNTLYKFYGKN